MDVQKEFQLIAAALGDPARAVMLWTLLDGRALTATELAICADVSAQSASMHLSKLMKADILAVESQGRHRYYRFAKPEVAQAVEAMAGLLPMDTSRKETTQTPEQHAIQYCRTCYDHLAGKVGVAITTQLLMEKLIVPIEKQYDVTPKGEKWFAKMGISVADLKTERRVFARQCLDWSERRPHLAGALGAALLEQMNALRWLRKSRTSRAVAITEKGQKELYTLLGLMV